MEPIVGSGRHRFRVHEDWMKVPDGIEVKAAAVTVDSQDRVWCFSRVPTHPVVIFDRNGTYLSSWGAGMFRQPHALRFDAAGHLWITDGHLHQFMKFTPDGTLLETIGVAGQRSETGVPNDDLSSQAWRKVVRSAGPFNIPNDIAFASDGSMFVADGYGNACVHKFGPDGTYRFSWGSPGTAAGQFNLPHGVWIDRRGRVLVADRENDRVQLFNQNGGWLGCWPTELIGPAFFYVDQDDIVYIPEHNGGMVSVLTLDGERLARWGGPIHKSCHGIWGDSHGDIYVVQPGEWGRVRRIVKYERI
ncbi:MAG: hypothetical protein AB7O80_24270 [Acetobacteraceae bacterium]